VHGLVAVGLEGGARRGCPRVLADGSVRRGGAMCVAARGSGSLLRRRVDPPSNQRTGGGRLGNARAPDDGERTAGP
jgi:hypothetical protein